MLTINNVATQDGYADALTLGPVSTAEKIAYLVANAAAVVQVAGHSADKTIQPWSEEILVTPTTGEFQRIQGMRFRSALPGVPAQVVAQLVEPGDPVPIGGTPFTQVLTPGGSISPTGEGMTPIQTIDLSTSTQFAGIPNTFRNLRLEIVARLTGAVATSIATMRFNGDVGANYEWADIQAFNNVLSEPTNGAAMDTSFNLGNYPAATAPAGYYGSCIIDIPGYLLGINKLISFQNWAAWGAAALNAKALLVGGGYWASLAAVNRIDLFSGSGAFAPNSIATLYGIP